MAVPSSGFSSNFFTNVDTFTGAGTGTVVDTHVMPIGNLAIVVKGTGGAATLWSVNLEGSFDNQNWTKLLIHDQTTDDGIILGTGTNAIPVLYVRTNCTSLTLGSATNIVVTTLGKL
jgi:hypothetical protein